MSPLHDFAKVRYAMFLTKKLFPAVKKHPRWFLVLAVLFSSALIYYQYLFGSSVFLFNDIGADTQQQYIMQYNTIVNHLRSGNFSLWDFSNGFGTSMFQLNLFDPSLILLYLLGVIFGPSVMPYLLIYLHIGKLILAGLMCYQFLTCFSFSTKSRLFASYLYAFNGFLMVWGQHYQFSMAAVYLPLYLYVLEKALRKKKFSPVLPIVTALVVMYSYYMGYMILATGGIYLLIRLFLMETLPWKSRIRTFFLNCGSMLLGVGMALTTLLPGYAIVTNVSSRLSSDSGLFERLFSNLAPYPPRYYLTLILRFFSSNLEGIGNSEINMPYRGYGNYYEAPNVFFSTLFVLLAVQYILWLVHSKEPKRSKITCWILTALAGFSLLLMTGSLIFNGFSAPFSRHTFILMPLAALMTAKMLDEIWSHRFFSILGGILSVLGLTGVYLLCFVKVASTPSFKADILLLCFTGIAMAFLLFLFWKGKKMRLLSQTALTVLLAICVGCNIIGDSHLTVRGRSSVAKGSEEYFGYLYNEDMESLLSYLDETDPEFHRVEKTFASASLCMESCAQGYRGISTYNSTINKNIQEFTTRFLPNLNLVNFSRLTYRHMLHDDVYATLFGIKYLVTDDENYSNDTYQFVRQFGSLYLYQNRFDASVGRLFTQTLDKDTYTANSTALDETTLLQSVVITDQRDHLSIDPRSLDSYAAQAMPDFIDYGSALFSGVLTDTGEVTWNTSLVLPFYTEHLYTSGPVSMTFTITADKPTEMNFITDNGKTVTSDYELTMEQPGVPYPVTLTIPPDTNTLKIQTRYPDINCSISHAAFSSQSTAVGFSKDPGITLLNTPTDSRLEGSISAKEDSVAFFAIPYEDGWTALLDGEPVELLRLDYGFTGFYVTPGEHEFAFTYRPPMLKEGFLMASFFWLLYFILLYASSRRSKC